MLIGNYVTYQFTEYLFDVNQTGHETEVLNGLYQRFFSPLRASLFRRSKREKPSGIQGIYLAAIVKEVYTMR